MTARRLAHFELLDKLGEGGMGVVFKARDTHLDRLAAIKILLQDRVADPVRKARFIQEAKAASALNHPNIVTIYDIASFEGQDYIAMEFIDGAPLDELIARGLRISDALRYAIQIADALASAHAAGIIHRDLKPANVIVTDRGLVKLLDFGLAKLIEPLAPGQTDDTRTARPITEEGVIAGSAPYMSPEQAEGKPIDHRSDIFSFGALLYEMLTGRRAFEADSRMSTLAAVLTKDPRPITELTGSLPKEAERIVSRCLRKDLRRRSQSIAEIKLALEEILQDTESGSNPAPAGLATTKRRRVRRLAIVLPVAVLALGAFAWFRFFTPRPFREPLRIVPLTTFQGQESNPALSPDGNQFAFAWDGGAPGPPRVYISLTGNVNPLLLTREEGIAARPSWSPDGQSIAFYRFDPFTGRRTIHVIPALGGVERKIGETSTVAGPISWFPDSKRICLADSLDSNRLRLALFTITLDGARTQLTQPAPSDVVGHHIPSVSPDGSRVAFIHGLAEYISEVMTIGVSPDGRAQSEPIAITPRGNVQFAVWTPNGEEILYLQGDPTDQRLVFRVFADGSRPRPAFGLPPETEEIAFPRTGRRMVFRSLAAEHNIWRADLSKPSDPEQFASSTRFDTSPAYSPDGKKLAFASNRGGSRQIWVANADGTSAVALTPASQGVAGSPRWSPDSQWIAYDARAQGNADVYLIAAGGGQPKRLTGDPASDTAPAFSPDGATIFFSSSRLGSRQIFRMPAQGGAQTPVTKNGGHVALPSHDGKWLYYTIPNRGLWKTTPQGGDETRVLEEVNDFGFAVTARGIYFTSGAVRNEKTGRREWPIKLLDPGTGSTRIVVAAHRILGPHITVSPGERWIAWSQTDNQNSDLMLVENFR